MIEQGSFPKPVVTVLLPFHNAEQTLATAVRSIVGQTFGRWCMQLIDDGSTDNGLAVAKSFEDERIRVAGDGCRRGISSRLNAAIKETTTQYVCRMDADDVSFPDRLARQVALLEADPRLDLAASSVVVFHDDGRLQGVVQVFGQHDQICVRPWRGFLFPHPTWLGRTKWFLQNPYDSRDDGAEDQALLYRAHRKSRLAGIGDVLLGYREDRRKLSKLLRRRLTFWKAVGRDAAGSGAWGDFAMVAVAQPSKIIGDFLHACGLPWARHRLSPVATDVGARWLDLWRNDHERG